VSLIHCLQMYVRLDGDLICSAYFLEGAHPVSRFLGNAQLALMQWTRGEMAKEGGVRLYIAQERKASGVLKSLDKFGRAPPINTK